MDPDTVKGRGLPRLLKLGTSLGSFKGLENLELDDHMLELEGSTPEKFKLAHDALKAILVKIGA